MVTMVDHHTLGFSIKNAKPWFLVAQFMDNKEDKHGDSAIKEI